MTPYMTHRLKIGSAGGSPAPVGDPPTGTAESNLRPSPLARTVAPIPSGESPDGTGGSPVLPKTIFQTRSQSGRGASKETPSPPSHRRRITRIGVAVRFTLNSAVEAEWAERKPQMDNYGRRCISLRNPHATAERLASP